MNVAKPQSKFVRYLKKLNMLLSTKISRVESERCQKAFKKIFYNQMSSWIVPRFLPFWMLINTIIYVAKLVASFRNHNVVWEYGSNF